MFFIVFNDYQSSPINIPDLVEMRTWLIQQAFLSIVLCFAVVLHHHVLADPLSSLFTRSSNAFCDIILNSSYTLI